MGVLNSLRSLGHCLYLSLVTIFYFLPFVLLVYQNPFFDLEFFYEQRLNIYVFFLCKGLSNIWKKVGI